MVLTFLCNYSILTRTFCFIRPVITIRFSITAPCHWDALFNTSKLTSHASSHWIHCYQHWQFSIIALSYIIGKSASSLSFSCSPLSSCSFSVPHLLKIQVVTFWYHICKLPQSWSYYVGSSVNHATCHDEIQISSQPSCGKVSRLPPYWRVLRDADLTSLTK